MTATDLLDSYLTKRDLAQQIGKTERTLDRWASLRIGPPRTLIGKSVFYQVDDVKAWLKAQREDTPQRRRA